MKFNKEIYQKEKVQIIDEMKKIYPNWKTTEGFIMDRVTSPDNYEKQNLKILYFLGESYGYDKNGITDIEKNPAGIFGIGKKHLPTSNKIPILSWLIIESINKGSKISFEEFLSHKVGSKNSLFFHFD